MPETATYVQSKSHWQATIASFHTTSAVSGRNFAPEFPATLRPLWSAKRTLRQNRKLTLVNGEFGADSGHSSDIFSALNECRKVAESRRWLAASMKGAVYLGDRN